MIDSRFSADAFTRLGPDTPEANNLVRILEDEIVSEIRDVLEDGIWRMVEQLREMGHEMREWERQYKRGASFSFGPGHPSPPKGWLAIHFDLTALAMFTRVDEGERLPAEIQRDESQLPADDEVPF